MQAILDLKVRPIQAVRVRESNPAKPEGALSRLNRAIMRFAVFQNDERLVQMDSPYRWFQ